MRVCFTMKVNSIFQFYHWWMRFNQTYEHSRCWTDKFSFNVSLSFGNSIIRRFNHTQNIRFHPSSSDLRYLCRFNNTLTFRVEHHRILVYSKFIFTGQVWFVEKNIYSQFQLFLTEIHFFMIKTSTTILFGVLTTLWIFCYNVYLNNFS